MQSSEHSFRGLLAGGFPRTQSPQVFVGEQRSRILAAVGAAIRAGNQPKVLAAVKKDPSILLDFVPENPAKPAATVPFAVACLKGGMPAGYLMAIASGFDINTADQHADPMHSWLLSAAVRGGHSHDVSLLLAAGAAPGVLPGIDLESQAKIAKDFKGYDSLLQISLGTWLAQNATANKPSPASIPLALMDAGASARDCSSFIESLVRNGDWANSPEWRNEAFKLMTRLTQCGLDVDSVSATPMKSPLAIAIGGKNGHATWALITLGIYPKSGFDIIESMRKNKMDDSIPQIQALLMNKAIESHSAQAGAQIDESEQSRPAATQSRRRNAAL